MCNIPLISILIMAAQASLAASVGLVTAASFLNGSIFRAWDAPAAMAAAAIAMTAAIASLSLALRRAANCAGACPGQTAKLLLDISSLITALVLLSALVVATAFVTAIPFLAKGALAAISAGLGVAGVISFTLSVDLAALAVCAAAAKPLTVVIIVAILGALLTIAIGVALVASLVPLLPVPRG